MSIECLKNEEAGELKVLVIPTVLPYALVKPLSTFQARYPKVQFTLVEAMTDQLVDGLRPAEIDLAVLALPIRHNEIVCSELFREPLLAAVPRDHKLTAKDKVMLQMLGLENMLLLQRRTLFAQRCTNSLHSRPRPKFHQIFESDHLESILRMVAEGYGISLVPEKATIGRTDCRFLPFEPKEHQHYPSANCCSDS